MGDWSALAATAYPLCTMEIDFTSTALGGRSAIFYSVKIKCLWLWAT